MAIQHNVAQVKRHIESVMSQKLKSTNIADSKLNQAMEYSLLLGGKRLRPFLVYATGKLFGASQHDLDAAAAAIEAIHSYSLIHDDLPAMDDDSLRRGKPTCHVEFDEATAILAGDTLQSFAFSSLTEHKFENVSAQNQLKLVQIIASSANQMCAGQSIDLQSTDSALPDLPSLENMHRLKTGALITAAVRCGAITANASEEHQSLLVEYANAIGLAFQVWDDVLDITSDTATLGKPQGSDESANKTTYPSLMGLEQTKNKAKALVDNAIIALEKLPYDTEELAQLAQYIIERDH